MFSSGNMKFRLHAAAGKGQAVGYRLLGLVSQMIRNPASVPANIAEGQARATQARLFQFPGDCAGFRDALGAAGYLNQVEAQPALKLITETSKILAALCVVGLRTDPVVHPPVPCSLCFRDDSAGQPGWRTAACGPAETGCPCVARRLQRPRLCGQGREGC